MAACTFKINLCNMCAVFTDIFDILLDTRYITNLKYKALSCAFFMFRCMLHMTGFR